MALQAEAFMRPGAAPRSEVGRRFATPVVRQMSDALERLVSTSDGAAAESDAGTITCALTDSAA